MKRYLEIKEELTKEERIVSEPEMIRIEVQDEAEARAKIKDLKPLIKNSKSYLHEHYHEIDSKLNRPCAIKELKEEKEEEEKEYWDYPLTNAICSKKN